MDNKKEQVIAVMFSIIGSLAIIINLSIKGFNTENGLDAVKDLVGLLVTVAVFLVAYSISNKSKSFIDVGRIALEMLRTKYVKVLKGPQFDKSDYNPDDSTKSQRMQYLFFTEDQYPKKVAFIPLDPIEQGILDIRVSKATFVNFGHDTKDPNTDKLFLDIQSKIYIDLEKYLTLKYSGLFKILNNNNSETKKTKFKNSAIVIDFDEEKLKMKGLKKAIYNCSERALMELLTHKK
ncbi:MAG: hypothetical protein NTW49_12130 [Bacteroidia bacterium]|nr:hypothetical protein [Bacteroidia bacterium]